MPPRWSLALVAILATLGLGLRVWQARESLWLDELHTAWCAGGTLAEVLPRAAIGNQSPLFFWLEWLLVQVFGPGELTLRLPSLVAGSLLPAALYGLAWRWTRSNLVALVAGALVVVDPLSIFYATEARPYALVQLLAVVHVAVFAELLARPTLSLRLAFIAAGALLFHLHYTAALLISAEIAAWLLALVIDRRGLAYRPGALVADLFYVAVLAAPAAWNVAAIASRRENWKTFVHQQPAYEMLRLLPWTVVAIFVLVDPDAFLRSASRPKINSGMARTDEIPEVRLLLVLCWSLVPVALAWLSTATDFARIFHVRYLALSMPGAMLLAALYVRMPPWPGTRLVLGLAFVGYGVWTSAIVPQLRYDGRAIAHRDEDWRSAVAWLNERLPQQPLPVLVSSGLIEADALRGEHDPLLDDYCLLPVTALYRLQGERDDLVPLPSTDPGAVNREVALRVGRQSGAWLIIRGTERHAASTQRQIVAKLTALDSSPGQYNWRVIETHSFGDVHVSRFSASR